MHLGTTTDWATALGLDEERQAIEALAASHPTDLSEDFYQRTADLRAGVSWRRPSALELARGLGRARQPRTVEDKLERRAIAAEGAFRCPESHSEGPAGAAGGRAPLVDRKQSNPPPSVPSSSSEPSPTVWQAPGRAAPWWRTRAREWDLSIGLRPIQAKRQQACRHHRLAEAVGLVGHADGRLSWGGLETCGSVWSCPVCSWVIRAERAAEVRKVVELGGIGSRMLTVTIRHHRWDELGTLRRNIADAWRGFIRGAPWKRFLRVTGARGLVRALEVTHGPNGWHTHIHAVIVGGKDQLDAQSGERVPWHRLHLDGRPIATWLRARWSACVRRYCGSRHVPSRARGVKLTSCKDGRYLCKLGLELELDAGKRAEHRNRTQWQIGSDWTRYRLREDAVLWRMFAEGMKGARQLTWSRSLREWAGLDAERTDEEIAADAGQHLGSVAAQDWRAVAGARTPAGRPVVCAALEIGEVRGARAALDFVAGYARRQREREVTNHGNEAIDKQPGALQALRTANAALEASPGYVPGMLGSSAKRAIASEVRKARELRDENRSGEAAKLQLWRLGSNERIAELERSRPEAMERVAAEPNREGADGANGEGRIGGESSSENESPLAQGTYPRWSAELERRSELERRAELRRLGATCELTARVFWTPPGSGGTAKGNGRS